MSETKSPGKEDPRARLTENFDDEFLPEVTEDEVGFAPSLMNRGKAPGDDELYVEMLLAENSAILKPLTKLFKKVMQESTPPKMWKNVSVTILHKKAI